MESYSEIPAIWDLTSPDSAHPGEQDFFEILQKQFAPVQTNGGISGFPAFMDGVNPQNLSLFPLSNLTPSSTSDDSNSPSPPTTHQEAPQDGNAEDPTLKRKASTDKLESEPNNKTQHTGEVYFNVCTAQSSFPLLKPRPINELQQLRHRVRGASLQDRMYEIWHVIIS